MPSGCEVDITGVVSMYALQLASGRPSALVDWNNNYADLQKLLRYVCKNGYEHHAAMNPTLSADILHEAFETYMGWEAYRHS